MNHIVLLFCVRTSSTSCHFNRTMNKKVQRILSILSVEKWCSNSATRNFSSSSNRNSATHFPLVISTFPLYRWWYYIIVFPVGTCLCASCIAWNIYDAVANATFIDWISYYEFFISFSHSEMFKYRSVFFLHFISFTTVYDRTINKTHQPKWMHRIFGSIASNCGVENSKYKILIIWLAFINGLACGICIKSITMEMAKKMRVAHTNMR